MYRHKSPMAPLVAAAACAVLLTAAPVSGAWEADVTSSDRAFNAMILEMSGQDTGSAWFDYYVETVNQQIAAKSTEEPFGAAGPSGPVVGFDGYVAGFVEPDTGSLWFDFYVDSVRRVLRAKEQQ